MHSWESLWRAGNDVEAQKTAWRQLADRFTDERAAWILHALEPTNQPAAAGVARAGGSAAAASACVSTGRGRRRCRAGVVGGARLLRP
jgi:hypothetical protein